MNGPLRFPKLKYLPLNTTSLEHIDVSHLYVEVIRPSFEPTSEPISNATLDLLFYLKSALALLRRCKRMSTDEDRIASIENASALLLPIMGDVTNMLTHSGGRIGYMSSAPLANVRAFHEALLNIAGATSLETISSPQYAQYTEYLTAASIYITQALDIFQTVNAEKVSDNQTEEQCLELGNITRMAHVCRYLLVRLSAVQTAIPHHLLRLLTNDLICASSLISSNTAEQYRGLSVNHFVLRLAIMMALIKPALGHVPEAQKMEAERLYESLTLVGNILLDKCLENVSEAEAAKCKAGRAYDPTSLLILGLNESLSLALTVIHHWKKAVKTEEKFSKVEENLGALSVKNRLQDVVSNTADVLDRVYGRITKSAGDASAEIPREKLAEQLQKSLAILKLMMQELDCVLPTEITRGVALLGISLQRTLDRVCTDKPLFDCCWDKKKCLLPVLSGEVPENRNICHAENAACVFDIENAEDTESHLVSGVVNALKSLVVNPLVNLTSALVPIGAGPTQAEEPSSPQQRVSRRLEVRLVDLLAEIDRAHGTLLTDLRQQMLVNVDMQTASGMTR
ncbi:hypothetical protein O998_03465 [Anaplasma phagocytophilum str. Norway variant1]|uniref:Uncharacterized protein n=1 Tax=Anaplasma phagocytophilum str. Norway variant1 TaxID=1392506 RepID=A0A7H9E0J5_ANAPH|nr:hypothetical protein [Anaplasma phagocytophilum]QLL66836.1 hypothetical protein O998_03465 [Anaplasma phagocytophilum str. Norway variant1]